MKRIRTACLALTAAATGACGVELGPATTGSPQGGCNDCQEVVGAPFALSAGQPPSAGTLNAMRFGLDDEYLARATYEAVIARFGQVRPFINIVAAEERHIAAILQLYAQAGLQPIQDKHRGRVEAPPTLLQACQNGVDAERQNAALYDDVLAEVDDAQVYSVLSRLRAASVNNHLPAFERCVARGGRSGNGQGGNGQGGNGQGGNGRGPRWARGQS